MNQIMKKNEDSLENLFGRLDGQWDIYEPTRGHADRFLDKLQDKKAGKKRSLSWLPMAVAACLVLAAGLFTLQEYSGKSSDMAELSKPSREADSVFTAAIRYELNRVREKNSPVNEQIIKDAMTQLSEMDEDYKKIRAELVRNGESEQLIHALISNLKTQISFLESVLERIHKNENLNQTKDENII